MAEVLKRVRNAEGALVAARFDCPGCDEPHVLYLDRGWTFNGDWERPTFSPSFLLSKPVFAADGSFSKRTQCHFILTDGVVNYCGDSPHDFAGKKHRLPIWSDENA